MNISKEKITKNPIINYFKNKKEKNKIKYSLEPELFNELYRIKRISLNDISNKEFDASGQEYSNTCGIACLRNYLYNKFNILFPNEYNLIKLAEDLYIAKKYFKEEGISNQYEIKNNGSFQIHLTNITSFFDLKYFSGKNGTIDDIIKLNEQDIPVIIYRKENKNDKWGHFLIAYQTLIEEKKIVLFDPSYRGERPKQNIKHNGTHKKESFKIFKNRWKINDNYKTEKNQNISDCFYSFILEKREKPIGKFRGYYIY
ncbi:MAG: hypothetical protein KatS3mg002_1421 [Candidatus Woesearchaeota archaeon]|nr:MAG: hypothetical protein KatS3mg002_1421 [Candidatus Woesearchaeota archaeon]